MKTITQSDALEDRIADVVAITASLVEGSRSATQKNRLRQAFADLAELKAQRSLSVIHRLDRQIGLGELS